jgi:hypothetical protein
MKIEQLESRVTEPFLNFLVVPSSQDILKVSSDQQSTLYTLHSNLMRYITNSRIHESQLLTRFVQKQIVYEMHVHLNKTFPSNA